MERIYIDEELLTSFLSGYATPEETYAIIKASKSNPDIAFILDVAEASGFFSQSPERNLSAQSVCKTFALHSSHLPVMRLAANTQANDCVVKCEQHVLNSRGKESQYKKLYNQARRHDWLKDEGTPLFNIGRLLELASLSVSRQFGGTIDSLLKELSGNCSIIAVLNAKRLSAPNTRKSNVCDHAVIVLDVDMDASFIEIYDPQSENPSDRYSLETFLKAWKTSKNFYVSIVERGVRPYSPHPEYVAHIKLPEEIASIADILAENAHEIWAKDRLQEAEKNKAKGKDVNPYDDPFMKPFNELSKQKRKTDYLSALNTIKLLYKLGFELTTVDKKSALDYKHNVRTVDGQYIPKPINVDDVLLSNDVAALTEYIAENAHEEWAKQRLKEGWTFAPKTNKKRKQSFDLVPYCELLDKEKEYDRKMAMNTLKVLYKFGINIEMTKE